MYGIILIVHSYLRYIVLLLLVVVVVRAVAGVTRGSTWNNTDERLGSSLVRVWDVQFLLGLLLYVFLSPVTQFAFRNFGEVFGDEQLREFTIEHPLLMLLATAAVHVGWVRARKATTARSKHLRLLIFIAVAALLTAVAIPWAGRPLLRTSVGPLQL